MKKCFAPHYRKSRKTHHLAYVYREERGLRRFVGVTHGAVTHRRANVPLPDNPDPGDHRPAFCNDFLDSDAKTNFGARKPWKVTKRNKAVFDSVIARRKKGK